MVVLLLLSCSSQLSHCSATTSVSELLNVDGPPRARSTQGEMEAHRDQWSRSLSNHRKSQSRFISTGTCRCRCRLVALFGLLTPTDGAPSRAELPEESQAISGLTLRSALPGSVRSELLGQCYSASRRTVMSIFS